MQKVTFCWANRDLSPCQPWPFTLSSITFHLSKCDLSPCQPWPISSASFLSSRPPLSLWNPFRLYRLYRLSLIIYNNVSPQFITDLNQQTLQNHPFLRKNLRNVLRIWQKVYTFALAFGKTATTASCRELFFERFTIQTSSTRREAAPLPQREQASRVQWYTNRPLLQCRDIRLWKQVSLLPVSESSGSPLHLILYRAFQGYKTLYCEEFDPGSGWTLATGLTHASRGAACRLLATDDGDRRTGE